MILVQADNLHKTYSRFSANDTIVLRGLSIAIDQGEYVALVGPSGAGKSTLLHILGGLDQPDQGEVCYHFNGTPQYLTRLGQDERAQLRSRMIGFVFQFHHLLPEFTALENVMLPLLLRGQRRSEAQMAAQQILEHLGLAHRHDHKPAELSGGEQQRVALARALVIQPRLLLADEPTGNLDSHNTQEILRLLVRLRSEYGLTVLVATHSIEVAAAADRILTMRDGTIVSSGDD